MTLTYAEEVLRETLLIALKEDIVEVVFVKSDGEERTMVCTLLPKFLPDKKTSGVAEVKKTKEKTTDVISVFDLEKNGWRSFNVASVKKHSRYNHPESVSDLKRYLQTEIIKMESTFPENIHAKNKLHGKKEAYQELLLKVRLLEGELSAFNMKWE